MDRDQFLLNHGFMPDRIDAMVEQLQTDQFWALSTPLLAPPRHLVGVHIYLSDYWLTIDGLDRIDFIAEIMLLTKGLFMHRAERDTLRSMFVDMLVHEIPHLIPCWLLSKPIQSGVALRWGEQCRDHGEVGRFAINVANDPLQWLARHGTAEFVEWVLCDWMPQYLQYCHQQWVMEEREHN